MLDKQINQLGSRSASVDNILNDNHILALDVFLQAHQLTQLAGGAHAIVALKADKRDLRMWQIHFAIQVGCKDECTVKHTNEQRSIVAVEVFIDFCCHALHLRRNLLFGDVRLEFKPL